MHWTNGTVIKVNTNTYTIRGIHDGDEGETEVAKATIKESNLKTAAVDNEEAEEEEDEEKQDVDEDETKDNDETNDNADDNDASDPKVEFVQQIFNIVDPNNDGKLAKEKFKMSIFTNLDVGIILSKDETLSMLKNPANLDRPFESLDTDNDGFVSINELVAFAKSLVTGVNDDNDVASKAPDVV